ncbi:DUF1269 domain-containing protein [Diaphorobacter sp. HDW4A]|uniref:DUF1269 domain-containing protein n=1 Tax=Diaphorobacter sp. HDW4A TaxID=2714924 RepID=UPI00140A19B6|nr:DUF1269 domain-containing protein [Diaphorobacter sp. HDW4A]QIL82060.1 DUF1269 domain-containing protein [Diaphorobacter sp. HDW4A]
MEQNVVLLSFAEESKAYQALSELKGAVASGKLQLQNAAVVQRAMDGSFSVKDGASDGGAATGPLTGTLVGSLIGMLAGPLGVLLGGVYGAIVGSAVSADKLQDRASVLDQMMRAMPPGSTTLIATVEEDSSQTVNGISDKLGGVVLRRPLAVVQEEVAAQEDAAIAAAAEARRVLREKKSAEWHDKLEDWKDDVGESLTKLKTSIQNAFSSKKS